MIGTSLGLGMVKKDWKYTFRVTQKLAHNYRNKVDGLVYGTAFREYNFSAAAQVNKKWGHSKFAINVYNNKQEIPDGSRDSLSRKFSRQVLDEGDDLNSYRIVPLHQHIQHYRIYNTSAFNIGEGTLNVLLGAQQSVRREYNHPTSPQLAGLYLVLNSFNLDAKYNFPEWKGIESTVGISSMQQVNRNKEATDFPIPNYNLFDLGGFFFAKKSWGKLDLSGGLRFDKRSVSWNDFKQFSAFKHPYQGFSGSAGLTYNFTERFLLKANVARGYRAPNITEIGSNGLDPGAHIVYLGNRNFVPEFNLQQDLGFIAYLKNVDLSMELFHNQIQNYIYQARVTDENGAPVVVVPGNLTYQYQQSKARLYGAEVSVNIHPIALKGISFNNSLAWVTGRTNGQYMPFLPPLNLRSQLKAASEKQFGPFSKPYVKLEIDQHAEQNRFYGLDDTESYTKGYTLFNAGFGASVLSKKGRTLLDIFVQADNLFNVAYQAHLNRLKYFDIYNMGRNLSVKLVMPIGL